MCFFDDYGDEAEEEEDEVEDEDEEEDDDNYNLRIKRSKTDGCNIYTINIQ